MPTPAHPTAPPEALPAADERTDPPPFLRMRGVTAWRGRTRVFDDLDLVIPMGTSAAILGPNGAGKSTLLKLLSREILPEHRDDPPIRLFGRARWNVWELRARLGIVSHDLQAEFRRRSTGMEVALSGFRSTIGVWPHQRFSESERELAAGALERMGVGGLADRPFEVMSTGEQRRVLLARALVHDPDVLVLDEPTSGLDPKACFQYLELVRGLMQDGRTVVLVTHHIHEIPPEIDRAILLSRGRVVADGPKVEVLVDDRLSEVFDTPLRVVHANGFFQVLPG